MTAVLNILQIDYYDGNLILTVALWHGDKVTISVPIPEKVKDKIRSEK